MRPLLALLLVSLLGCGGTVFVSGATGSAASAAGTVSIVQLTVVDGKVNATVVTLVANNNARTLTFCGNNTSLFPVNSLVQVNFTSAQPCISAFQVSR